MIPHVPAKAALFAVIVSLSCSGSALAQSFLFNRFDFTIGIQPGGIAVGDFNRDGELDVAITGSSAQTVTIYRVTENEKLWVITEADRFVTTLLLPAED